MSHWRRTCPALLAVSSFVALWAGCYEEIDMNRPVIERGTLGEEIYGQLERDLARSADRGAAKADALRAERDAFVQAVDTLLPREHIPPFEALALDLLPFMDDQSVPDLVRKLAFVYEDIATDTQVREAWARSNIVRQGMQAAGAESDLVARVLSYPRLRELTDFTLDLVLQHDGLTDDGQRAPEENDFIRRLLLSIRDTLRAPDDPTDLNRNVAVVTDLLLTPDLRYAGALPGAPIWGVRPDARGVPVVAHLSDGRLPLLFTDADADGMVDIDAQGAFVDPSTQSFVFRPFDEPLSVTELAGQRIGRDESGRAFLQDGTYIYEYLDLNQTALGYVVRRTPELIERAVLNDTFLGLEGILGELDRSGEYPHFTNQTVLLDVVDALFQVAEMDELPALLELASILLDEHESTLATFIALSEHNGEINDRLGAHMEPNNGFLDDLLPYVWEIAQHKGLLEELLQFMASPWLENYLTASMDLLTYMNPAIRPAPEGLYNTEAARCIARFELGSQQRYDCIRAIDRYEIFAGDVDYNLPELDGNVSLHQRLLHLLYDSAGVPFSMEIVEMGAYGIDLTDTATELGPLLTIPDVAAAFLDSVAGNFCLENYVNVDRILENDLLGPLLELADVFDITGPDDTVASIVTGLLSTLSDQLGVHLDECPGPDQLLRFFNLPTLEMTMGCIGDSCIHARLADAYDLEGYLFREHHGDVLFAAEAAGAVDALHHVLRPFSLRGLSPMLARMLAAIYRHFPEPDVIYYEADGTPADFTYGGLRRHEPALLEYAHEGRFGALNNELANVLLSIELSNGAEVPDVLEAAVDHLLDAGDGVVSRSGATNARRDDGQSTAMTRYYLLNESIADLDEVLAARPESQEAWDRASVALEDLLLDVEEDANGRGYFVDPGSAAMGANLTAHLARHVQRHMELGDFYPLIQNDYPAYVEDLLTSRGFAAVMQLVGEVRSDPADQALFDDFLRYVTAENESATRTGLSLLYELLLGTTDQVGFMGVAPFYAELLDPDRTFAVGNTPELPLLTHAATVLRNLLSIDPEDIGIDLLRRGLLAPEGAEPPLSVLARVIRQINRLQPGASGPMTADDLEHLYTALYEYIRDDFAGVERCFEIIRNRYGIPE